MEEASVQYMLQMRGGDHPLDGNTYATLLMGIYKGQKVYKGGQSQPVRACRVLAIGSSSFLTA